MGRNKSIMAENIYILGITYLKKCHYYFFFLSSWFITDSFRSFLESGYLSIFMILELRAVPFIVYMCKNI